MEKYIIVNFKHYENATGTRARSLAESLLGIRMPPSTHLYLSVSPPDLARFGPEIRNHVISQHVDPTGFGAFTGKISMEYLLREGITGSLINHSENRIGYDEIMKIIDKAGKLHFTPFVCVKDQEEGERIIKLRPPFVAYEPPELIGGNVSVSRAKPEIISDVVSVAERYGVKVLVGAGIKNARDYQKSLELGAAGVLIASGVVKAENPKSALSSLINSKSP